MEALRAVLNGMAHPDWRGWYRYYRWAPWELLTPVGTKSPILTMKVKLHTIKKKINKKKKIPERHTHKHTHDGGDTALEKKKWRRSKCRKANGRLGIYNTNLQRSLKASWANQLTPVSSLWSRFMVFLFKDTVSHDVTYVMWSKLL